MAQGRGKAFESDTAHGSRALLVTQGSQNAKEDAPQPQQLEVDPLRQLNDVDGLVERQAVLRLEALCASGRFSLSSVASNQASVLTQSQFDQPQTCKCAAKLAGSETLCTG